MPNWIDCEEQMPEIGQPVLASDGLDWVGLVYRSMLDDVPGWRMHYTHRPIDGRITHYQPLPKPSTRQDKESEYVDTR